MLNARHMFILIGVTKSHVTAVKTGMEKEKSYDRKRVEE